MRSSIPFVATLLVLLTNMLRTKAFSSLLSLRKARIASTNTRCFSQVYKHQEVERKWQQFWEDEKVFRVPLSPANSNKKKYILDMFPYPSGAGLHVGHPEGYTATDILSRYWRMQGYDVLHPMGWDSFGLPAEQHAIATGTHPAATTQENIANFKRQLKSLGFSYDWERELATTDEKYVRWTQWIFLQLFKKGLAYQNEVQVNWCPALGTVLANEEIIDGKSERGNHPVVRIPLRQWILRITAYADRLEQDLTSINWPEGTLNAQKQWIGKSQGVSLKFDVHGHDGTAIEAFTTRVDTLMGVTYLALAPEHPLCDKLVTPENKEKFQAYRAAVASKSDLDRTTKSKTGMFSGSFAVHPITAERVPIWIADFVLGGYGFGAVMGVPGHDERDFQFASEHKLPVKTVVGGEHNLDEKSPFCEDGTLINSGSFNGLSSSDARRKIAEMLAAEGKGETKTMYKLRDWVFSRQRYWGEPIPIYFPVKLNNAGDNPLDHPHEILFDQPIPVDEKDLPLRLPEMTDFHPGDDPAGCLARAREWRYFQKNGDWFARETNTMPQWAGSCWYYLRFIDPNSDDALFRKEAASWLPVDMYIGGQEHAVLHLLYARFWHKVLYDLGVVDHKEPFQQLVHQGMILGSDGEKMSKSRGNVVNPDDVVREHGADALRLYEMFMGPLEAVKPWQTSQLIGVVRFRDRVFNLLHRPRVDSEISANPELLSQTHKTIKKVTEDIEKLSFNTAISTLMIYTNLLGSLEGGVPKDALKILLQLVSPFAPHVAEEGWQLIGEKPPIALASWPTFDEQFCRADTVTIAVQINGKVRGKMEMPSSTSQEEALTAATDLANVKKYLQDSTIRKVVYVPGKILSIIT